MFNLFIYYPSWIHPQIVPFLPFRWYSLMYIFAFIISYLLFRYQVKKEKLLLQSRHIDNLYFLTILFLLIGGRLGSVFIYSDGLFYLTHPWLIFWPFAQGHFVGLQGMSYHGAIIGGLLAVVLYSKRHRWNTWYTLDLICATIPLGYTLGRLGNFINGELYGRITTSPLGIVYPHAPVFSTSYQWVQDFAQKIHMNISNLAYVNLPRYPSELMEAFFEGFFLWLILWFFCRNWKNRYPGFISGCYVLGYGVFRFIIEYFRQPDTPLGFIIQFHKLSNPADFSLFNFSMGQILCSIMIIAGISILIGCSLYYKSHSRHFLLKNKDPSP